MGGSVRGSELQWEKDYLGELKAEWPGYLCLFMSVSRGLLYWAGDLRSVPSVAKDKHPAIADRHIPSNNPPFHDLSATVTYTMPKTRSILWSLAIATIFAFCLLKFRPESIPEMKPDLYPPGTAVTLRMWFLREPLQLGPRSSQLFLDMLAAQPVHSRISEMPAKAMGVFTVSGTDYYWHGNGVIHSFGRNERLWHGAYLQRLIRVDLGSEMNRESLQRFLDSLEQDPTVESTPLDGPGAYPGGRDALHPVRMFPR